MTYCENCQQLEGKTRETDDGIVECVDCGEEVREVPEHDDGADR